MCKICVFAGTTEGRQMVEFLSRQHCEVLACVATEYGETLLPRAEHVTVSAGRLTEEEMEALFFRERFDLVLDATHPHADAVTGNLVAACAAAGTGYLRLLRENGACPEDAVFVADVREAAAWLDATEGNILLTTGSKEIGAFASVSGFADRVYARVLPLEESMRLCTEAGLKPAHILAMQGPFSEELNTALLRAVNARYLVTKESGRRGGFDEKLAAARRAGAKTVIIGRPPQGEGLGFAQAAAWLCAKFGFVRRPRVTVAGIGPGSRETMTAQVRSAIRTADCLIGARRMLEAENDGNLPAFAATKPEEIAGFIEQNSQYQTFTVLMSGDTGFYSGTKKLLPLLNGCEVTVLPGLSSLAVLCARLGTSYEDVYPVTVHGRVRNVCADLRTHRRVFVLVGGDNGVGKLCRQLCDGGFGAARVSVGERLGYPEEQVTVGTAEELAGRTFDSLSAVLVETDRTESGTPGLPDGAFLRTEAVPMTKSEVRAVCLSKLRLHPDSLCWDVGAGTGSVSVEMALQAPGGRVYAIERKAEALELLEENRRRFAAENLTVVPGTAPGACAELPAPTHVFLGGSGGHLREILQLIRSRNPDARIVATAVSLETVGELTACCRDFARTEIVSLTVARDRRTGPYHLMTGQNPIYIFTMQGGKTD